MDFFEIMDFAGFDLEKANAIAKELIKAREIELIKALEKAESESKTAPTSRIVIMVC